MAIYAQVKLASCLGPDSPSVAHRPWIDGHVILLVEGEDSGWSYLTEEEAEVRGGFERVLVDAGRSLEAVMQRPGSLQGLQDESGEIAGLVGQGNPFVSGLLLQTTFVGLCREHLGDDFLVCAPAVDEVVAFRAVDAGGSSGTALSSFRLHRHPVSPHVYGWDGRDSLRVVDARDHDATRLRLGSRQERIPEPGDASPAIADPAHFEGQSVEGLTDDHGELLDQYRQLGVALIQVYEAAPDGKVSPSVLDGVLRRWREDTSEERPAPEVLVAGLGALLGDLLSSAIQGEWVSYADEAGEQPAIRTGSGALCHPFDSVHKRLDEAEATLEALCLKIAEASGGRTGYG